VCEAPKLAGHIVRMNKVAKFKADTFIKHRVCIPVN